MKTALIAFRKVKHAYDNQVVESIVNLFNEGGFFVDEIFVLADDSVTGFVKKFEFIKSTVDNLIILDDEDSLINTKELIAENLGLNLTINDKAKKFVEEYNFAYGKNATPEYALLPEDSTLIPNETGAFQGYMLESDFLLIALPTNKAQVEKMCTKFVLPYLKTKYGLNRETVVFKAFGISDTRLEGVVNRAKILAREKISFLCENNCGDQKITIIFDGVESEVYNQVIKFFLTELKDFIYAEEDCFLSSRLVEILKLYKIKLSTAESFTGGRIASDIVKISGASEVFNEGIVAYSNDAKKNRLFVTEGTLNEHGAVSKQTAYQMASGLLINRDTDFVIATTGIAGPNSDGTDKPVGLGYIALGSREGIHLHKLNLSGDRETITETAKNKALFLAIQLLKQM